MSESNFTTQEKIGYRTRDYNKNEIFTLRPGLIGAVQCGGLKIMAPSKLTNERSNPPSLIQLVEPNQMFELYEEDEFAVVLEPDTKVVWHNHSHLLELNKLEQYNISLKSQLIFQRRLNKVKGIAKTKERIFQLLELLYQTHLPLSNCGEVPGCLTHAEIAVAIGTTRVTVTRLLIELRQELRVETKDGQNFLLYP
jgi:CRP-like cAMP-binding protein